jgi:hypothetical protein
MIRAGAGVTHATTGRLGRVLRGRPCRGMVRVLFDDTDTAVVLPERAVRLFAARYATAKGWLARTAPTKPGC